MKTVVLIMVLASLGISQQKGKFNSSKWWHAVTQNGSDSLELMSNRRYVEYSCEINERLFGKYKFVRDTLYLYQERGEFDQEDSSEHKRGKALSKYLLNGDSLRAVYSQPNLNFSPITVFDTIYVYHKLKK